MSRIDHIPQHFIPQDHEADIYAFWQNQGFFKPDMDEAKPAFSIVMPPPNITGKLHLGHALDLSLPDILIRQKRMAGYAALFLPGTDHASIATEAKVVEALRKNGQEKADLGRDAFLERAWAWKEEYGNAIIDQIKRLGVSCDWSRTRFTLDDGLSKAVRKVFCDLYHEGLIYRGERLVNWCSHCGTSISDIEVEYAEEAGHFWYIHYPLADGSGQVTIATTRPETLLGDTALAVNPADERFRHLVGKQVILPLMDRKIPIIADDYVKMDFGTGIVKITPAHDPNDFAMGERHHLPSITVIDKASKITEAGGKYAGLTVEEARRAVVEDLEAQGYLVRTEKLHHEVGHCSRCHSVVEPLLSTQWFVKMDELAKPALEAVRKGDIEFVPDRFSKIYYNWMENIRDWCISRQLWWGHQIPAWYCEDCGQVSVSATGELTACEHCGSKHIKQDPDTLDTWFSSALWPFSTMGWPDQTVDLEKFFPTDVLVTGYDIIFFWVARMIFSSLKQTGKVPFRYVYLHGLVRDSQGRKMSKSLGNGIDPLKAIDQYGADALRFALINGISPGNDTRFSEEKLEAGRNFSNKLWNSFRFALMNFDDDMDFEQVELSDLEREDRWILNTLQQLIQETNANFERFELGIALGKIYTFLWNEFCDWYIEMVKSRLRGEGKTRLTAQYVLNYVLVNAVKLLHPYMPFITEEIYRYLIHPEGSIMEANWPLIREDYWFPEEAEEVNVLKEAIVGIRNIRSEKTVPANKTIGIMVVSEDAAVRQIFRDNPQLLDHLAGVSHVDLAANDKNVPLNAVSATFASGLVFVPLEDLVDLEEEATRLEKEIQNLEAEVARSQKLLSNQHFTAKAPAAVVDKEKQKLVTYRDSLQANRQRLQQLRKD